MREAQPPTTRPGSALHGGCGRPRPRHAPRTPIYSGIPQTGALHPCMGLRPYTSVDHAVLLLALVHDHLPYCYLECGLGAGRCCAGWGATMHKV